MVRQGITSGYTAELHTMLKQAESAKLPEDDRLFFVKLASILEGNRDLSMAGDTGLYYRDAVELHLLLEVLHTT